MNAEFLPELLEDICGGANTFDSVISVYLAGSVSRGEHRVENGILKSDVEIVIFDDGNKYARVKFGRLLNLLAAKYDVKLDYSYYIWGPPKKLPNRLFFYDLQNTGKRLCGINVLERVPRLELEDIDPYDINNIMAYRGLSVVSGFIYNDEDFARTLLANMSYVYFYLILVDGKIFKNFRERFEFLDQALCGENRLKYENIYEILHRKGDGYDLVKDYRFSHRFKRLPGAERQELLTSMLGAMQIAINREKFGLLANVRFFARFIKSILKKPSLILFVGIFLSFNPRKKVMVLLYDCILKIQNDQMIDPPIMRLASIVYDRNML